MSTAITLPTLRSARNTASRLLYAARCRNAPTSLSRLTSATQARAPRTAVFWAGHGRGELRPGGADRGLLRAGVDRRAAGGAAHREVDRGDAGRGRAPRRRGDRRDPRARRGGQ